MMYLKWLVLFPFELFIKIVCFIFAPIVGLFYTKRLRLDRVKRLNNQQVEMQREYIVKPLYWCQTHDNAVDEYWWGCFNKDSVSKYLSEATQEDYDSSWFLRYACRVMWLWRNCAYGFAYHIFGSPNTPILVTKERGVEDKGFWWKYTERAKSFQLKVHVPTPWKWFVNINIGWKAHKGFDKVMFAGRLIGTGI